MIEKNIALMVGNPAKQNGWMCECGEKLLYDLTCAACGKRFKRLQNILKWEETL